MSDHDLTPAQEESVREHLAAARHTDPVPAHVAARLDARLAELVAEAREAHAPVTPLAPRRRRLASTGLLAAAAAVVLGVAVTQVIPSMTGSESDAGSSAGAGDQQSSQSDRAFGAEEPGADAGAESNLGAEESQRSSEEKSPIPLDAATALVSTSPLAPQVRAARRSALAAFSASPVCAVPGADPASQLPVTFDGEPAVLVFGATSAGRQPVDVHLCGQRDPLRSVQLRAR